MYVTLVVDGQYGTKAIAQAELGPIWLVGSPINRDVVKQLWAADQKRFGDDVTYFDPPAGYSVCQIAMAFIGTVDEHHPNWRTFEIVGIEPSAEVLDELQSVGGAGEVRPTAEGFIFLRHIPSN